MYFRRILLQILNLMQKYLSERIVLVLGCPLSLSLIFSRRSDTDRVFMFSWFHMSSLLEQLFTMSVDVDEPNVRHTKCIPKIARRLPSTLFMHLSYILHACACVCMCVFVLIDASDRKRGEWANERESEPAKKVFGTRMSKPAKNLLVISV